VLAWVAICWVMTLGLVAVALIPSLTDSVSVQGTGVIATFTAPTAFRVAMLLAASALVGASVVWVLLRERVSHEPRAADAWMREAVILTVPLIPVLTLMADAAWAFAAIAAIPALTFAVLAHLRAVRRGLAGIALLGLLAAVPWLVLVGFQVTPAGSSPSSWLWIALFGSAAAFAAFGSYYGVARAAESRSARLTFLYRADLHPALVLGIVLPAVAVVALRLTVARDLFPEPDPQLWTPFGRSAVSWTIALVVAAIIVAAAVPASRNPLARFGERRVIAILAALGNLELIGSLLVIALGIVVAIVTATVFLPTVWMVLVPIAKFVGVVVLVIVVLLPPFRGTAARWIGLATGVFLAGTTLNSALRVDFAATPVQVLLVLLAAAVALSIWNLVQPTRRVTPGLVARFAVVPLIAVHAGWLLPAAWSELGRIVVVLGVLLALFWLMPPVAADRTRHGLTVLGASLAQLVALLVFVLAIPSLFADGALTVLGLLWLSIPVIAALTIDTVKFTQPTMEDE
jgi:hypothetical protein